MKGFITEIPDTLIADLVEAGFAERINLFDAVITDKGIEAIEKLCCPEPTDSRLQLHDFTASGQDSSVNVFGTSIRNHE